MKEYLTPEILVYSSSSEDVISTSPGTEGPVVGDNGGIWDLNID